MGDLDHRRPDHDPERDQLSPGFLGSVELFPIIQALARPVTDELQNPRLIHGAEQRSSARYAIDAFPVIVESVHRASTAVPKCAAREDP